MERPARAVVVHGLDHARAALAAARDLGVPVALWSAPGAGRYAGAGWFAALTEAAAVEVPDAAYRAVLDCGDDAGAVSAALRSGVRAVRFTGPAPMRRKLADIASRIGAEIVTERPECLDPQDVQELLPALGVWLQSR